MGNLKRGVDYSVIDHKVISKKESLTVNVIDNSAIR